MALNNETGYNPVEYREWQCPPAAVSEDRRLGWLNESTEEGQAWLKAQRGFGDFARAFEVVAGRDSSRPTAAYRSQVATNRLKRNMRETIGTLAKLKPFWGYHSDNEAYKGMAEMLNKVSRAWYLESFADRTLKESLAWAATTGRGWVRPIYRRAMYGTGKGDIKLLAYGAPSVLPVQLPATGNWQEAYAVTILEEMPVAMAHGMFPMYQDRLRPSNSRYWYANDGVRKASLGNVVRRIFGATRRTGTEDAVSENLIPVRYTYIIDLTVNKTNMAIPMGEPGASWSYTVPYVGMDIPIGIDPQYGQMTYRKADENDARLYPFRRLVISSDNCIMYDGPSFDWHGMLPAVSFTIDSWPWEPLGFSMVHDGYDLQSAINEIARGNMDKIRSQLNMSLAFDINAVSKKEADAFDPMQPFARVGYDGTASESQPFNPVVPPEVLKVSPESMAMWEKLEETMDSQTAIKDITALARMRAVGSMDDMEKIMEANGPIIEDMSRSMEPSMRDLGVMVKYLLLQYVPTARVMQYVGLDGVAQEVFDFDPTSLVPSHLPGESVDSKSQSSSAQRARILADNLRFMIMPNTLHEMSQMTMKLGLIQLKKAGVQIDSQTIAEAWNIPNYGSIPGNTVRERYQAEQEEQLEMMARMKLLADGLGLTPPQPPGSPGKGQEGRPPSGQAAPALKSKEGGARSTITES